ncbi:MAG: hypothetical protein IKS41_02905 [Alphaproteobacteria bacterium]|nr:hypothetical protein [Alphaproteobacteria bacterium]
MRFFLLLLLGMAGVARAETMQDLSQNNASPEEIIQKLKTHTVVQSPKAEARNTVHVGTVMSLIRKSPDTPFYDFTIALTDNRVITVSDTNHLGLKPGDMVILTEKEYFWQIKSRLPQ